MSGIKRVWATVLPPGYAPPVTGADFETPNLAGVTVELSYDNTAGKYLATFAPPSPLVAGVYTVTYFLEDLDGEIISKDSLIASTTTTTNSTTTTTTTETQTTTATSLTLSTTTTTLPGNANATLPVAAGWSLLSSTINIEVPSVFSDSTKFISIWKWTDGGTGSKTWAVYLPGDDGGVSYALSKGFLPLTTIASGEGFWVNGKSSTQVAINGQQVLGSLNLSMGWNLVGLKSTQSATVTDLIASTSGTVSMWKWANNTWSVVLPNEGDKGAAYAASKGFSQLTTINPGEGFWVNVALF